MKSDALSYLIWKSSFASIILKCFSPGYYCLEGSQTATPMSSESGSVCPAGHYCTEGSSVPSPCPAGSYQNETGGKGKDDCKPCPFGKQEVILYAITLKNWVFLYCTNSLALTVWMSFPGLFQELSGQKECNPCPPGFHCQSLSPIPTRGSSTGVSSPLPCPAGYICPRESPDSHPIPCPKGTYSPNQGLTVTGKNSEPLWKKGSNGIILHRLSINDLRQMLCGVALADFSQQLVIQTGFCLRPKTKVSGETVWLVYNRQVLWNRCFFLEMIFLNLVCFRILTHSSVQLSRGSVDWWHLAASVFCF